MAFRWVPPGRFRMGSRGPNGGDEDPIHIVDIKDGFWMGETPVAQGQFGLWSREHASEHQNHFKGRSDHPAENMTWFEAADYCRWLSQSQAHAMPYGIALACLPNEAAWEYACRAGAETDYYSGDGVDALRKCGWFGEAYPDGGTYPVRGLLPNSFGLYDIQGNVWEWCSDAYDRNAYRKRGDGWDMRPWSVEDAGEDVEYWRDADREESKNQRRVLRGGSWIGTAGDCRSACRSRGRPGDRNYGIGFRVCLVRGPAASQKNQARKEVEAERAPGDGGRGTRPESEEVSGVEIPDLAKERFHSQK